MACSTLLARPTCHVLQHGALGSLLLNQSPTICLADALSEKYSCRHLLMIAPKNHNCLQVSSVGALYCKTWRSHTAPTKTTHRAFSLASPWQRKWMERQQPTQRARKWSVYDSQTHPQPQPQLPRFTVREAVVSYDSPTTIQRASIATWGLIGLFVAVWCAHNYAEGGSVLPNGIPLPKPPGWESIMDMMGFGKEPSKPSYPMRGLPSRAISPAQLEIKTNFSSTALSYRISDYPPPLTLDGLYPFYTSIFAHFEPLHLAINSYWTFAIAPGLMLMIGIPKTLAVFTIGGIVASEIQCVADKAYALNQAPWLFKYIKAAQRDPNPNGTMGEQLYGSSGALFAMGTVRALVSKQRSWRLFGLFCVTLDAVGYYMDLDTGVSYSTHLAGVISGGLLWVGWIRWTKAARMLAGLI